jgi:hypothetical protein
MAASERAEGHEVERPRAIEYQPANEDAIKAWLGDDFGYTPGRIFFDFGAVVKSKHDMNGGPGCWLVRTAIGVTIVDADVIAALRTSPVTAEGQEETK